MDLGREEFDWDRMRQEEDDYFAVKKAAPKTMETTLKGVLSRMSARAGGEDDPIVAKLRSLPYSEYLATEHWRKTREPGWVRRAWLNGIGAVATAAVAIVQVATKFTSGAWIVVLIIPLIIAVLRRIHRHYEFFAKEVAYTGQSPLMFLHHTVIVPVNGITKPAAGALVYATTICEDVRAVYVEVDPNTADDLRRRWTDWDIGVELTIIPSPYRSIMRPLVDYVNGLTVRGEADLVTVVVPEIVPRSWLGHLLHNKTSLFIRTAFLFRPNVVVTAVPYLVGRAARLRDALNHDDSLDDALDLAS